MKQSKFLELKNWRKESNAILVLITLILANGSIFSEQLITLLHEAPFTVSDKVDTWIIWILKALTFIMSLVAIFTKKTESTAPISLMDTNWEVEIAACTNLDELGALVELPLEYYEVWLARYYELGYTNPAPTHDEIRAGSVGTSGPKK